jgi:hypothetical protein
MSNYREFWMHFMTVVLLFTVPFFVVPNLSSNLKNYESEIKTLKSTRIFEEEYTGKNLRKKVERTLILEMTDGTEIRLSTEYGEYWNELQSEHNIGKQIKYYLGNNIEYGINPVQLEVENKIIYDPSHGVKWGYILVLMTIGMAIYSRIKLKKFFSNNDE